MDPGAACKVTSQRSLCAAATLHKGQKLAVAEVGVLPGLRWFALVKEHRTGKEAGASRLCDGQLGNFQPSPTAGTQFLQQGGDSVKCHPSGILSDTQKSRLLLRGGSYRPSA